MKRLIVLLAVLFMFTGVGYAENHETVIQPQPSFFESLKQNATIDALYDFKTGEPMIGAGVPLLQYKEGLVEARLEFASNLQGSELMGGMISFDPLKAIELTPAGNWQWIATFTFKAGIGAMVDISESINSIEDIHVTGYLKLIEPF